MAFLVHAAGAYSVLVDAGRRGFRNLGVPAGGPADRLAFTLGNALVGNVTNTVALEFAGAGPTLEATHSHACAIFGAPFTVWRNETHPIPVGKSFNLKSGDRLRIAATENGVRGYLCVAGGFAVREVLGSRSAWTPLANGDVLHCPESRMRGRFLAALETQWEEAGFLAAEGTLRILEGPEIRWFSRRAFAYREFTVSRDCDRMGVRLESRTVERKPGEMTSSPVCPGTIQITNEGQAIILGVDAQTIGGYPRIGHVIDADLDRIGQLRPGETVRFSWVGPEEAEKAALARRRWLDEMVARLLTSPAG